MADLPKNPDIHLQMHPEEYRILHLPTDTVFRYDNGEWRPIATVTRVERDNDQLEDITLQTRRKTVPVTVEPTAARRRIKDPKVIDLVDKLTVDVKRATRKTSPKKR